MRSFKILAASAVASLCFFVATPPPAQAQISVGIGVAPACPYGYYEAPPYSCAPYGYYGPEWFSGGVFIGAGPWFHGPAHFNGYVDNHYHPENGYHGAYPHVVKSLAKAGTATPKTSTATSAVTPTVK